MEKYSDGFVRNHFENGMLLSCADLTNLQNYFDGKRRTGNSGLIGYGVVFGLTAEASADKITVNPGLAIDKQGREIYVPSALSVPVGSLLPNGSGNGKFFLYIEYAEEFYGESFLISESKLTSPVRNRIRETFKLTLGTSFENNKICIAGIMMEECGDTVQILDIDCSLTVFHLSAMWKRVLPQGKSGLVYIDKEDLPDNGGIFRTKEISHGLGTSRNVTIELSVKSHDKWRECEIFGSHQLFGVPVQLAAKIFPATGTFVIAVKPQDSPQLPLCICWYAYAVQEDDAHV